MRFAVFSKHLQDFPLADCCQRVAAAGFDGLDLTVRDGGYISPANVGRDLPAAVRTIRGAGLEVPLLTTGILHADAAAEAVLASAAQLGIPEIKLHYWPVDGTTDPRQAIRQAAMSLEKLANLAERNCIRINIHNHSGDCVQHNAVIVDSLLAVHDPRYVGAYFDPAHYTLEGALAGWKLAAQLLAPRVTLLAVKDFRWVEVPTATLPMQERRWVPVGAGNVDWRKSLEVLAAAGFDREGKSWASVHGEYQGRWSFRELTGGQVLEQCTRDRDFLAAIVANIHD